MRLLPIVAVGAIWIAHGARAQEAQAPSFWSHVTLEAPIFTRHFPNGSFNNQNWGLLADVAVTRSVSLVAGDFRNSYRRNTAVAGLSWEPVRFRADQAQVALGAMAGVDLNGGYRPFNSADPFLAALNLRISAADPEAGRPWSRFGVLVTVIPPAPKAGATAVNLALTYRLR